MIPREKPTVHPLRATAAELPPAPSLEVLARDRLVGLTVALACLHVVVGLGHLFNPQGWDLRSPLSALQDVPWSRIPAWTLAIGSAFFLLLLRLLLPRLPLRWSFPLGEFVSVLLVLNALGWFTLGLTPEKTVPLAFALLGAGFLLFTTRSLVRVIAIAAGGWFWFARQAGFTTGWYYFGGVLAGAAILAILFQRLQVGTIRQMLRSTMDRDMPPPSPPPAEDEHFRQWYEATFEGIAIHQKGIIIEANQALATLMNCDHAALPGQNLLDWFTRASRNVIEESILLGNFRPFEAVALRPDKSELHVELFSKRIQLAGRDVMVTAFRDITERQRAAAALDAEQLRLQHQYRRQVALAQLAVQTGESTEVARILDAISQTATNILGLRAGACILVREQEQFALAGSHLANLPNPFDAPRQLARVSDWIQENRETFIASDTAREDPFQVNDPEPCLSAYVGVPLLDGERLLGVFYALDTEEPRHFKPDDLDFLHELANRATVAIAKARLYEQLSEANRVLQRQSALLLVQNEQLATAKAAAETASEAKSQFLAKVSHELRTPMNGVVGMTDYLLTTDLDSDQRESAEAVRASADRLMAQIDHILDFSRLEQGSFTPAQTDFPLEDLTRELLHKGRALLKGQALSFRVSTAGNLPPRVRGDRAALRRALWNILENAIRFTPEGEIVLRVATDGADTGTTRVEFTITDTGRGIAPEEQAHLFDPFAQLDNSLARAHEGLGLGLATSKRLIEQLGGTIQVQSELDKGSAFTVLVPLEVSPAPAQPSISPAA